MAKEKAGIHLTGGDSGFPVGHSAEPPYRKDGTGTDDGTNPHAESVAGNIVTTEDSVNEVQTLVVTGTGGTWKPHASAAAVAFDATQAQVQAALEAVYGAGGVTDVRTGAGPYTHTITFRGRDHGFNNEGALTASDVDLTGVGHGVIVATVTQGVA